MRCTQAGVDYIFCGTGSRRGQSVFFSSSFFLFFLLFSFVKKSVFETAKINRLSSWRNPPLIKVKFERLI